MATAFENLAPRVVSELSRDLGITPEQAAGIVGNLAAESGLLAVQERNPISGRGGYGWAQWTGPRRVAFETWCRTKRLAPDSYEANYGFLVHELQTSHATSLANVRLTKTAKAAAQTFGYWFERFAGFQNLNSANYAHRIKFAEKALALYRAKQPVPVPAPTPAPVEPPMPVPAPVQTDPVLPPKPWYQSRQIIGAIVGIALPFAARYVPGAAGLGIDAVTNTIIKAIDLVAPFIGGWLVVQGRLTSTRPIAGTQAAVTVMEARAARQDALLQAHATVPPGYAPVEEAWASEQQAQLSPDVDLAGFVAQLPFEKVIREAAAVAPFITAALNVGKMMAAAQQDKP